MLDDTTPRQYAKVAKIDDSIRTFKIMRLPKKKLLQPISVQLDDLELSRSVDDRFEILGVEYYNVGQVRRVVKGFLKLLLFFQLFPREKKRGAENDACRICSLFSLYSERKVLIWE